MENVLIVAYLLITLALIGVILIQRSEGGGLGMGSAGGMMTVRGSANLLTRTTAILATLFMAIAIGLTILSELDRTTQNILDRAVDGIGEETGPINVLDALNNLNAQGAAASGGLDLPTPQSTTAPPSTTVLDAPATAPAPAADPGLAVPAPAGTPAAPGN